MKVGKRLISGVLGAVVGLGGVSAKTKKNAQDTPPVNKTLTKRSKKIKARVKENKIKRNKRVVGDRIGTKASSGHPWSTKKKALVGAGIIGTVAVMGGAAAAIYNRDKIKMYLAFRKIRGMVLSSASEYSEAFRDEVSKFLDKANYHVRFRSCDVVASDGSPKCKFVFDLKEMSTDSVGFSVGIEDKKLTRSDLLFQTGLHLRALVKPWLSSKCPVSSLDAEFVDRVVACLVLSLDLSSVASKLKDKGIEFVYDDLSRFFKRK